VKLAQALPQCLEQRVQATFQARVPRSVGDDLLSHLEGLPGVRRIRIELAS
jgi:hypothetical protein